MTWVQQRSRKTWLLIGTGMAVTVCAFLAAVAIMGRHRTIASVKVPGTNLTLVLYEDENRLHRYDVLAGGRKVAREVQLGSRGALTARPQVSVLGEQVIITFRTSENTAPYVEFDRTACRIVGHSNPAAPAPPITDCQRR
jgi:hypothetical protein